MACRAPAMKSPAKQDAANASRNLANLLANSVVRRSALAPRVKDRRLVAAATRTSKHRAMIGLAAMLPKRREADSGDSCSPVDVGTCIIYVATDELAMIECGFASDP